MGIIKENEKVKKKENTLSTKKATKKKRKTISIKKNRKKTRSRPRKYDSRINEIDKNKEMENAN